MVADPVALYIHDFDTDNFRLDMSGTPDDPHPEDLVPIPPGTFKWQRGDIKKHQGLRLQVAVPEGFKARSSGLQLNVSDIWDTGRKEKIRYGAQFADYITMSVSAVTVNATPAEPVPCYNPKSKSGGRTAATGGLGGNGTASSAILAAADVDVYSFLKNGGRRTTWADFAAALGSNSSVPSGKNVSIPVAAS